MQFGREWTKFAVRFREVSALERVPLQRYKCNSAGSGPNLLSGLERCPVWREFRYRDTSAIRQGVDQICCPV